MIIISGLVAAHIAASRRIQLSPADCEGDDCTAVFAKAVADCRSSCSFVLAPGRYRASCPPGSGNWIRGPAAVDLSNTSNCSFGGESTAAKDRVLLEIDYVGAGCPAVSASNASGLLIRNLVIDTVRLPYTDASVSAVWEDDAGQVVQLQMHDTERMVFDMQKYPWLAGGDFMASPLKDFTSCSYQQENATATLHFGSRNTSVAVNTSFVWRHYHNLQSFGIYGWRVHGMAISSVTLLAAAGMGIRCDFCAGTFGVHGSSLKLLPGRRWTSTADGIHLMFHDGEIVLRNSSVEGTGDDVFNCHSNFFLLADTLPPPHANASSSSSSSSSSSFSPFSALYIDESGPGWIPGAPSFMAGDRVAFFSRLTLQQIGPPNVLVSATANSNQTNSSGGVPALGTASFLDPIPEAVRRFDMFTSLERRASLDIENCTFTGGPSRGLVVSASPVRIVRNTFTRVLAESILVDEGGCGAGNGIPDYTEAASPFTRDVLVHQNVFDASVAASAGKPTIQFVGCVPDRCNATVSRAAGAGSTMSTALPQCEPAGSAAPNICPHRPSVGPQDQGHVMGKGHALDLGGTVFANITVSSNAFLQGDVGDGIVNTRRIIQVGATDGLVIANNTAGAAAAQICVYSSQGFDAGAAVRTNRCGGAAGQCAVGACGALR